MSRLEWVLGILLVLLLLIVVGVSAMLWFRPEVPTLDENAAANATAVAAREEGAASTPVVEGRTARLAFVPAQNEARQWQEDAVLVQAQATWPRNTGADTLQAGAASWSYTFYSPEAGRTALIVVRDEQASLLSESANKVAEPLANVTGWNVDSQQALTQFLEAGGSAFMRDARTTTAIMELSLANENQRPEWFMSLFANRSGRSFNMRLDASTGDVIEVERLPQEEASP